MHVPGFGKKRTEAAAVAAAPERLPGESLETFEARRAAYIRDNRFAPTPAERRAYKDGRRDQHAADKADQKARRRGGFGLISVLVVLIAAVGVMWLVLAAREGSFAAGGAVVDRKVAEATQPARTAANQAMDRTGAAVQSAGQAIETQGERLRPDGEAQ